MALASRFCDLPLDTVFLRLKTAFASDSEGERMNEVRKCIQHVREHWRTNGGYVELANTVWEFCKNDAVVPLTAEVQAPLSRLFNGYRDYADIDNRRPEQPIMQQYDAVELYCSDVGYRYFRRIILDVFRSPQPSREQLLRATVLVEFVTIELYNLRLSQFGDPRYGNFEGVTYRGMLFTSEELEEYRHILAQPDLAKRNFSIPLGLMSSSTDERVSMAFSEGVNAGRHSNICTQLTIHVYGMDQSLLQEYRHLYPDSVVTTICAMPVAPISSFDEKEILLRGPFFHLIAIETWASDGKQKANLVVVTMNSNRDHGSELSANDGLKKRQRDIFNRAVNATKWRACATVAEKYCPQDAAGYRQMQEDSLTELRSEYNLTATLADRLAEAKDVGVWLGAISLRSYTSYYADRRRIWQGALKMGDWITVERIIDEEYPWRRTHWYSVGRLLGWADDDEKEAGDNFTLLHELVRQAPEGGLTDLSNDAKCTSWKKLVTQATGPDVWKTVKSSGQQAKTAEQLAHDRGYDMLADLFKPTVVQDIAASVIVDLEQQLHGLMKEKMGPFAIHKSFHFPQLSVLTEMETPKIWIPVACVNGGFLLNLHGETLDVTHIETRSGQVKPTEMKVSIRPRIGNDAALLEQTPLA
ncbi:hypothetical protein ACCO45_012320 [Purpureocillium lilacinum]|uniref:Uncharacterized protein n=1 Tax=Purpureocillium lilacinum TaxID=33203 RepID=A0ACC4D8F6_PURLI